MIAAWGVQTSWNRPPKGLLQHIRAHGISESTTTRSRPKSQASHPQDSTRSYFSHSLERIRSGEEIDEETFFRLVRKGIKQRKDSAEQYREGSRAELAEAEEREAQYLLAYLPAQAEEAELRAAIQDFVEAGGLSGPGAIGPVMKTMVARFFRTRRRRNHQPDREGGSLLAECPFIQVPSPQVLVPGSECRCRSCSHGSVCGDSRIILFNEVSG